MSIRLRLTLWYSGILAVTLLCFGMAIYFFLSISSDNQIKNSLQSHAEKVYDRISMGISLSMKGIKFDIQLDDVDTFLSDDYYLQVVNLTNGDVTRSGNAVKYHVEIPIDRETVRKLQEQDGSFQAASIQNFPFLIYNKRLVVEGKVVGVLQVAAYAGGNEGFLDLLRSVLILSSVIIILLAASVGWFLARKALKPIDHVTIAADQIEKGADLDKRIVYNGPNDEIGRLTNKINGMLSRIQIIYTELEEAYRAQRRFVSDASHELRTPLTTIRGNVDLLEKMWTASSPHQLIANKEQMADSMEAMQDIADEAERMTRLVNDLLSLARADAGYEMAKEPIELKPIVDEVVRKAQLLPRQVEWRTGDLSALEGVWVEGNKDYLQQLLFIFIENAFKYTEKGYVEIDALRSDSAENQIGIRITDTGIGMYKEEVPHIFERFYRADLSRGETSGTGLGLSIARWIIDAHNGSIEVTTRKEEGSTFKIWLPASFQPGTR